MIDFSTIVKVYKQQQAVFFKGRMQKFSL